ncbi:hypothetical protein ACVME8_010772 [Bradyrhizobium diazoefficiens]
MFPEACKQEAVFPLIGKAEVLRHGVIDALVGPVLIGIEIANRAVMKIPIGEKPFTCIFGPLRKRSGVLDDYASVDAEIIEQCNVSLVRDTVDEIIGS